MTPRAMQPCFHGNLAGVFLIALQTIMQLPEKRTEEILKNTCGSSLSECRIPFRCRIIASVVYDIPGALPAG